MSKVVSVLEDVMQAELFARLDEWDKTGLFGDYIKWIFAIPNGGFRDKKTAAMLKKTGVKRGPGDICCPWPVYQCGHDLLGAALYVEMKRTGMGRQSDDQKAFEEFCHKNGNQYELCDTVAAAELVIMEWVCEAAGSSFQVDEASDYKFEGQYCGVGSMALPHLPSDRELRCIHNVRIEIGRDY